MEPPENFPFPFPPYRIQDEFMRKLYVCLESGSLGIFESPTGTGKSLSIICGALKWLHDHETLEKKNLIVKLNELNNKIQKLRESLDDWFSVQSEQIRLIAEKQNVETDLNAILKCEERREERLQLIKKEYDVQKKIHNSLKLQLMTKKKKKESTLEGIEASTIENESQEELILEDTSSYSETSEDDDASEDTFTRTKIFFCSRTHSQLSQFIGELKQSPYGDNTSVVVLGSRQSYCINENVKNLKRIDLINDKCLQMQKQKTTVKKEKDIKRSKAECTCPFMPGNQELLKAHILTNVQDIEEIVQKSIELKTCGYYASRNSIQESQLILIPYNSILHKSTRDSLGINLKGAILIIDEAHNLLDAIERSYTTVVTGKNLLQCYNQLTQYQERFKLLFSAKSILYLNQLGFCIKKLLTIFGGNIKSSATDLTKDSILEKVYKLEEFETLIQIDTVNIFNLLEFVKHSKLTQKLQSFVEQSKNHPTVHQTNVKKCGITDFLESITKKEMETEISSCVNDVRQDEESKNHLTAITHFLESLKSCCLDGRIIVTTGPTIGEGIIKFILLNAAAHFDDIIKDTRAVVLAGGTMEPMSEFTDHLLLAAGATPERIIKFSCDHVVPLENILCNIVTNGPTGMEFLFNFNRRQDIKLLDELGRAILNLCNVVPSGIVVFLPSYNYEESVYDHFSKYGIINKISAKKRIFREPKSSSQVHEILQQYATSIENPQLPQNGSLLFSVIGGKLSEGLNFSDNLGRCIVVVGMPYPNINSPELKEKINYLNTNVNSNAGHNFYENACMKAVNQCIGRAVRHIKDYASVILLDKRYSTKINALPCWIQRKVIINSVFGNVVGSTAKFFITKRK